MNDNAKGFLPQSDDKLANLIADATRGTMPGLDSRIAEAIRTAYHFGLADAHDIMRDRDKKALLGC